MNISIRIHSSPQKRTSFQTIFFKAIQNLLRISRMTQATISLTLRGRFLGGCLLCLLRQPSTSPLSLSCLQAYKADRQLSLRKRELQPLLRRLPCCSHSTRAELRVTLERSEVKEQQQDKEYREGHAGEKPAALSWITCYGDLIDGTTTVQGEWKSDRSVNLFIGLKITAQETLCGHNGLRYET